MGALWPVNLGHTNMPIISRKIVLISCVICDFFQRHTLDNSQISYFFGVNMGIKRSGLGKWRVIGARSVGGEGLLLWCLPLTCQVRSHI